RSFATSDETRPLNPLRREGAPARPRPQTQEPGMTQDRGARLLVSSICERCNGVFAQNPWTPDRADCCVGCGAGRHWERRRDHQILLPDEIPEYPVAKRDVLSWGEPLAARYNRGGDRVSRNYGK